MRPTTIHLPAPCHESWGAMTPTAAGRYCAACEKTVVDFTQKTDAEILAHLARAAAPTCGRFRAGQVGRPLQLPETASRWRSWLAALLAVGGLGPASFRAEAQVPAFQYGGPPEPVATGGTDSGLVAGVLPAQAPAAGHSPNDSLAVVQGVVCDASTCEPLPGATVTTRDGQYATVTDAQGKFQVVLKPGTQSVHLVVSFVGFVEQERTLTIRPGSPAPIEVPLEASMLGGMEVSISRRLPWPWHPRALYCWGRYWVTRPFRQ